MFIHSSTRASSSALSVNTSLCIQTRASLQAIEVSQLRLQSVRMLHARKYVIVISVLFLDTAIIIWGFQLHSTLLYRHEVECIVCLDKVLYNMIRNG